MMNGTKRTLCIVSIAALLILLGAGIGISVSVLNKDNKSEARPSVVTPSPSMKETLAPTKSGEPITVNRNKVSTSSYGPPPSPCMECITRDALDKKGRRLLFSETSLGLRRILPEEGNRFCETPSLLNKLIETGDPYFESVELLEAEVGDAKYDIVCNNVSSLVAKTPLALPESSQCSCPYRDVEPSISLSCEEIAVYDIYIKLQGRNLFGIMTNDTIRIYENTTTTFLQESYDLTCPDAVSRTYKTVTLEEQMIYSIPIPFKDEEPKCSLCSNGTILKPEEVVEGVSASCEDIELSAGLLPMEEMNSCEEMVADFSSQCCENIPATSTSPTPSITYELGELEAVDFADGDDVVFPAQNIFFSGDGLWKVNGEWYNDEGGEDAGIAFVFKLGNIKGDFDSIPSIGYQGGVIQEFLIVQEFFGGINDQFGTSVAISYDGRTLAIGANGEVNFLGTVTVYDLTSAGVITGDQFVPIQKMWGEVSEDGKWCEGKWCVNFGWRIAMTLDSMFLAVVATGTDFGAVDAGSVYFYERHHIGETFKKRKRVDGQCTGERLGSEGLAINNTYDVLMVHAKADIGDCINNGNNIRTFQ
eukprot:CAMPEP_0194394118 /NCGR_PEP_ID=MMETSP0174-20130528/123674_1 /TAXON_ID=216777 /ORGANISM="Proboscia alata, Strain PI-D3" /LENGTH=588 /DNA_ID=CAMNT_0039189883 /DNA_START=108 /DNA_END=1874 /DNA_ORIENTATION=+